MKNYLLKIYTFGFIVLTNVSIFAQGNDDDNGDLEGNDPPAVPINSKIIFLMIAAIVYSFYLYNKRKSKV